ncbi:hypothetical protein LshimejAT787_0302880 [Lyophyllum shimeji]|uniref:Uncharacterized protein n=1 Tax=Lyophyllum shimeji TaxID=47721 RepID=A0A9P3PH71_LYOSH|nr:hypothetical protein LshimejAT787_0302880 [Lyophyllum shimeji]
MSTLGVFYVTSSLQSSPAANAPKSKGVPRPRATRSPIARNLKQFETWSTHQCCEQVSYSNLPEDAKADVWEVFDVMGRLPMAWIEKNSKEFQLLSRSSTPAFQGLIEAAYGHCPALFSDRISGQSMELTELHEETSIVFSTWCRPRSMRKSKEKWSEADYVANVYNVFRSPATRESVQRVHCTTSLPQPSLLANMGTVAARILNTKAAVPDCAILIPTAAVRSLSHSEQSPFHATVVRTGNASKGTSSRYRSTRQLPETPGFECASNFWEDKKRSTTSLKMRIGRTEYQLHQLYGTCTPCPSKHRFLGLCGPVAPCGHMWTGAKSRTANLSHPFRVASGCV